MKRLLSICAVLALASGIFLYSAKTELKINAPDTIILNKGERFCLDDYIEIIGDNIVVEYSENININKEGTYSLTVKAEDDRGKLKEKNIIVTVR